MTSNIISELNDDFSEDFFEVLHISVGQKIEILENRPDFLIFSAKTHCRLYNRQILRHRDVIYFKKELRI